MSEPASKHSFFLQIYRSLAVLNESVVIGRGGQRLYLGGIGDAHFYGMDHIEEAAAAIPQDKFSILISHTPEAYRQAADANFNVLAERSYPRRPNLPSRRDRSRLIRSYCGQWARALGDFMT